MCDMSQCGRTRKVFRAAVEAEAHCVKGALCWQVSKQLVRVVQSADRHTLGEY